MQGSEKLLDLNYGKNGQFLESFMLQNDKLA